MFLRLRGYLRRPVVMGWVLVTYIGIITALVYTTMVDGDARQAVENESRARDVAIRHEATKRADDLCEVLVDVHVNAHFRLRTERQDLRRTKAYLRTSASYETPALRAAIVAGLKDQRARIKIARQGAVATIPPASCGTHHHNQKES